MSLLPSPSKSTECTLFPARATVFPATAANAITSSFLSKSPPKRDTYGYGLQVDQAPRGACFPNGIHPLLGNLRTEF